MGTRFIENYTTEPPIAKPKNYTVRQEIFYYLIPTMTWNVVAN